MGHVHSALGFQRRKLSGDVGRLFVVEEWSWVVVITHSVGVYLGDTESKAEDQEFPLPADVPVTLGPVGPGSAVFAYGPNDSSVSVSVQPLPWLAQVVLALGRFFERRAA